jgi:tellurite resistance protein TerC
MLSSIWLWIGFNLFVLALLALDLGVFHRKAHTVSVKEAAIWSIVWISLSLLFNGAIFLFWERFMPGSAATGGEAALEFLTGYLIEKALAVDNIFVFLMIFTGVRMAFHKDAELHPDDNPLVRLFRRFVPVTEDYVGAKFFVRQAGRLMATPLLIVLLVVESTDLVFAVDSIPAIFAVTEDPFIVYTSNVCAILGLRSLYFLLAGVIGTFHYLKLGLSVVLAFVGVKMLLTDTAFKIPIGISLGVIALILTIAIVASLWRSRRIARQAVAAGAEPPR